MKTLKSTYDLILIGLLFLFTEVLAIHQLIEYYINETFFSAIFLVAFCYWLPVLSIPFLIILAIKDLRAIIPVCAIILILYFGRRLRVDIIGFTTTLTVITGLFYLYKRGKQRLTNAAVK